MLVEEKLTGQLFLKSRKKEWVAEGVESNEVDWTKPFFETCRTEWLTG